MTKTWLSLLAGAALLARPAPAQTLINGAGSTFDYPAFTKWFEAYGRVAPQVRFNYQSIGSGAGQKLLMSRTVDFGASDAPMKAGALAVAPGKILHLPILAGGVAVIYNLPDNPRLRLDGDTLADIYLGHITTWNDARIAALNPGLALPETAIIPVHRADGSGTSYILTDYLSVISAPWAAAVGKGSSVRWPAGIGLAAKGSEGVVGEVRQLPGAIGYAEPAFAHQNKIPSAVMKNAAGRFTAPAPASVAAALAAAAIPDDFRFSMVNSPAPQAYPIAGLSWVLVYQNSQDPQKTAQLVAFLKWAVTKGQDLLPALDYAPLPESVQRRELALLEAVK